MTLDDTERNADLRRRGTRPRVHDVDRDATVVSYLCSAGYAPGREHGVHPLDPDLGIEWPDGITPLLVTEGRGGADAWREAREGRAAADVRRVPGALPQPARLTGARATRRSRTLSTWMLSIGTDAVTPLDVGVQPSAGSAFHPSGATTVRSSCGGLSIDCGTT